MADEKKVSQVGDYLIKRCISKMMRMAFSTKEKDASFDVLKDLDYK